MIIAIPAKDHGHLADALVRDLGFTRTHVDAPLRELLLALDPLVDSGVTLANMGPSPRLSSKLEQVGGGSDEGRWDRLLHPPRPGSSPDRISTEVKRLLGVLRDRLPELAAMDDDGDVVVVGECEWRYRTVAITGRYDGDRVDHWIAPAGVVGEQEAIVAYVKELRDVEASQASGKFVEDGVENDECTKTGEWEFGDKGRALTLSSGELVLIGEAATLLAKEPRPVDAALLAEAKASVALDGDTQCDPDDPRNQSAPTTDG